MFGKFWILVILVSPLGINAPKTSGICKRCIEQPGPEFRTKRECIIYIGGDGYRPKNKKEEMLFFKRGQKLHNRKFRIAKDRNDYGYRVCMRVTP